MHTSRNNLQSLHVFDESLLINVLSHLPTIKDRLNVCAAFKLEGQDFTSIIAKSLTGKHIEGGKLLPSKNPHAHDLSLIHI